MVVLKKPKMPYYYYNMFQTKKVRKLLYFQTFSFLEWDGEENFKNGRHKQGKRSYAKYREEMGQSWVEEDQWDIRNVAKGGCGGAWWL